jgi:hypothetical protein
MPDPTQIQTPGQMLAGQPQTPPQQVGNTPLATRLAQDPTTPPPAPQQQQPAPQPTPQQAVNARHNALGKVTSFLFGQQHDPQTGEAIRQQPGAIFRSLLAGALLGGAVGSEGHASGGSSVGGFLSGFAKGGNAVQQQNYQRQQDAQAAAQKKQGLTLEQQKFDEEKTIHAATLEHWNIEQLMHGREADFKDREQLDKENEQDENIQKWASENGAFIAPTIPGNGVPGNGQDMMKNMIKNPAAFNPPTGMGRLVIKKYDFDRLDHDAKDGWTENGKQVDWSKHMTWTIFYVPSNASDKTPISMSGADWHRLYGVNFPPGSDPSKMYNVKTVAPLISVATSNRKQEREDSNETFKQKHDALSATIGAARTNVIQLNSEKRELLRQGYGESDAEVKDINGRISDEQKREQDAISEMHPRVRSRVSQPQTPAATPPGKANDASNTRQSFSIGAWKKANPKGDVDAAKAEAKKRGYNVVD